MDEYGDNSGDFGSKGEIMNTFIICKNIIWGLPCEQQR